MTHIIPSVACPCNRFNPSYICELVGLISPVINLLLPKFCEIVIYIMLSKQQTMNIDTLT